jgi:hypothetical protein
MPISNCFIGVENCKLPHNLINVSMNILIFCLYVTNCSIYIYIANETPTTN